nr:MAG TPA: hypothetical protein [Crassvirales sp.]
MEDITLIQLYIYRIYEIMLNHFLTQKRIGLQNKKKNGSILILILLMLYRIR